jgi:SAM-dependent methyltransferase
MKLAEFDQFADEYYEQHKQNIAITGEAPEYFAEYKIADLDRLATAKKLARNHILDFGSGIGNSIPYFRKYFATSTIVCADISRRSIALSRARFPGNEIYVEIEPKRIPVPDNSQDIVFSACVFHHIDETEHSHWLRELLRIVRPGGILAIFEHNPLNPLTLRAVNTCPFDINARLMRAGRLKQRVRNAGWVEVRTAYRIFFPNALAGLRTLEPAIEWLCFGAQYRVTATKPS